MCGHWAHSTAQRDHRHLSPDRGADQRQEPTGVTPRGPPQPQSAHLRKITGCPVPPCLTIKALKGLILTKEVASS